MYSPSGPGSRTVLATHPPPMAKFALAPRVPRYIRRRSKVSRGKRFPAFGVKARWRSPDTRLPQVLTSGPCREQQVPAYTDSFLLFSFHSFVLSLLSLTVSLVVRLRDTPPGVGVRVHVGNAGNNDHAGIHCGCAGLMKISAG